MSRGGVPPYRGEREYASDRYRTDYGSDSRAWSANRSDPRAAADREREWARYDWERYDRERYERERYDRDRAAYARPPPRRVDDYGGSSSYVDRRSESYGWDENERASESRRWNDAREYRDRDRDIDRYSESRYQSDFRTADRGNAYRERIEGADVEHGSERDRGELQRSAQRPSITVRRSRSPGSRRLSPSSSTRRHSPPPNTSTVTNPPTGPRHTRESWTSGHYDRAQDRESAPQPPTGPRKSYVRPPHPQAYSRMDAPYDNRSYSSRTPTRSSYDDQSRPYERSSYSNVPNISEPEGTSVTASPQRENFSRSREGLHPKDSISNLQIPTRSPLNAVGGNSSSYGGGSGPITPAVAGTPDGTGSRKASESQGSGVETQFYTLTLERIRSVRAMNENPASQSLRKALHDLADSEVELAGARIKTSVTELSMEKAREEAEAWSIESARLDLEHKKSGSQGYWNSV